MKMTRITHKKQSEVKSPAKLYTFLAFDKYDKKMTKSSLPKLTNMVCVGLIKLTKVI